MEHGPATSRRQLSQIIPDQTIELLMFQVQQSLNRHSSGNSTMVA